MQFWNAKPAPQSNAMRIAARQNSLSTLVLPTERTGCIAIGALIAAAGISPRTNATNPEAKKRAQMAHERTPLVSRLHWQGNLPIAYAAAVEHRSTYGTAFRVVILVIQVHNLTNTRLD